MKKITSPSKNPIFLLLFFGLYFCHNFLANSLTYSLNEGISFGVSLGYIQGLLMMLILVVGVLVFRDKKGMLILMSGALVNVVDRFKFGGVRDYWNFLGLWVNNINDWVIFIGMVILIVELWKENIK